MGCEHIIMVCQVCGDEYDNDFSPPLKCHYGFYDWDIRIENRIDCHIHRSKNGN